MKKLFPGFYTKSNEELKKMWDTSLIVFDTNVLLNLYRYSESTQNELLNLIESFEQKIYLPYYVAFEFNKNRLEVIAEQEKSYKEFSKNLEALFQEINSTKKNPFFSKKLEKEFKKVTEMARVEIEANIEKYKVFLKSDPIYNRLSDIFADRIIGEFTVEECNSLYKEGEIRYSSKIPPGYKDSNKKEGNIYGDLIIWKQILNLAKEKQKDIIFISDDNKEDWWWKLKDERIIGPRNELVREIYDFANVDFHMYSSERFLKFGSEALHKEVDNSALEEIEAMKITHVYEKLHLDLTSNLINKYIQIKQRKLDANLKKNEFNEIRSQIENSLNTYQEYVSKFSALIDYSKNHNLEVDINDKTMYQNSFHSFNIMIENLLDELNQIRINDEVEELQDYYAEILLKLTSKFQFIKQS